MSTEYEFYCKDCNASLSIYPNGMDTSHYNVPMMQAVVESRHAFAEIALDTLDLFGSPLSSVVHWMRDHHGHNIAVRDEYGGDADNPCRKYDRCPHCDVTIRCGLPNGHEPPCRGM